MMLLRHVMAQVCTPCTWYVRMLTAPPISRIKINDDLSFFTSSGWRMEIMSAQMIDRLSFSVSGPRHIVTEFQDVGGAGALGEEEGAQACAVHHTNPTEFFL
jgi:hypothetical protein